MTKKNSLKFAAALSVEPDTRRAVEEVCQRAAGELDGEPHLALLFATRDHVAEFDWIAAQVGDRIGASCLLGCAAESVVGGELEVEHAPGISLWLAHLPGAGMSPMHLRFQRTPDGSVIEGWPEELEGDWPSGATLLLLGDPFSFPADLLLGQLNEDRPGATVVGGMASGGAAPGQNRLLLGRQTFAEGAAAMLLQGPLRLRTIVSQGCRPVGRHLVVTRAQENVIHQLGGKPALLQLKEIFDTLPNQEKQLVQQGLHLGRVVNEYQDRFEQGDFLVRNVLGIDPDSGSIAVGDHVRVGQTVQFHVRDHTTAGIELRQLLARAKKEGVAAAAGALLFTCNGRGQRFFGAPHHDARAIQESLGPIPLGGLFAQGELGPVGGKNFMHGFTASVALLEDA